MKLRRHEAIIDLVNNQDINTQEELMENLQKQGFKVTQATVSRDIKELRIFKALGKDGSIVTQQVAEMPLIKPVVLKAYLLLLLKKWIVQRIL